MKVVVTRPAGQGEPLASRIEALGHDVVLCPLIRVDPLGDEPVELSGYDWLIVTSRNGAAELGRRARGLPRRVAAIGPGTADALALAGLTVDLVPRVSTQEGLLAELPRPVGRVLFAAAEGARTTIRDELGADFVPLYRTTELRPEPPPVGDLVVLASASAARAFGALAAGIPAVSIGPQTSEAARAAGIRVMAEAERHDLDGLVEALARLTR
ncbi:MAG TPA: uroporphyrinogen-III synthase [Gaiellaceae bacterium]|nr:uroporphyrinogen-III synthase [Gaiellaceae bacterium]